MCPVLVLCTFITTQIALPQSEPEDPQAKANREHRERAERDSAELDRKRMADRLNDQQSEIEELKRRLEKSERAKKEVPPPAPVVTPPDPRIPRDDVLFYRRYLHRHLRKFQREVIEDSEISLYTKNQLVAEDEKRIASLERDIVKLHGSLEAYGKIVYDKWVASCHQEVRDLIALADSERKDPGRLSYETKQKLLSLGKRARAGEFPYDSHLKALEAAWRGDRAR